MNDFYANADSADPSTTSDTQMIGALPGNGTDPSQLRRRLDYLAGSGLAGPPRPPYESGNTSSPHAPPDPDDRQYRMGIGQRILGSVANFLNGFSKNGAGPIYVGPGAHNSRYGRDLGEHELYEQALQRHTAQQEALPQPQETAQRQQFSWPGQASAHPSTQSSPLDFYDRAVAGAAMENDPTRKFDLERGLRVMENIEHNRQRRAAVNVLTPAEEKEFRDRAFGVDRRLEALQRLKAAGGGPEVDADMQRLQQQRQQVEREVKARN